jgi:hypothetical protein
MAVIADRVRWIIGKFRRPIRCSACHLTRAKDRKLIAGPGVYICESCIAETARLNAPIDVTTPCSFCGRRDVTIAGAWPKLAICVNCVGLARAMLAGDDPRARPAT